MKRLIFRLLPSFANAPKRGTSLAGKHRVRLQLESLEDRQLLSASVGSTTAALTDSSAGSNQVAYPLLMIAPQTMSPQQGPAISGFTPTQIRQAYGVSTLLNHGTNGKGETIAIVDAYYDPKLISDVGTFDKQFGLQLFNVTGGPTLKQIASGGGAASSVSQDSTGGWDLETSLDVEWAHAIAPEANIVLVEAPEDSDTSLFAAVQYAATKVPGVAVVSMSWGDNEYSSETSYDSVFMPKSSSNPNGANPGVTFVVASGDNGAGASYPAASPYVLSVGGTSLTTTTNSSGATVYGSETAWSGSGGGPASFEGYPSYQYNEPWIKQNYGYPYNVEVYNNSTGTYSSYSARMTPDVAYNADPNTGYAVYDSIASPAEGFAGGWGNVGGTSAAAPQWAAIVALADQQRAAKGEKSLDTNQVLTSLYNTLGSSPSNTTYKSVFHDITTGSNGYNAGPGYDMATGLGTPIVNKLVPLLANTTVPLGQLPTIIGSGDGGSSTGSGTSSYSTSLFGFTAGGHSGGGLYTGSGSLSLPPGLDGSDGQSGQTSSAPAVFAANLPASAPLMPFVFSTSNAATTKPEASTGNLVGNVSTFASASPYVTVGSITLTSTTIALTQQDKLVFGASGWNGGTMSSRQSSPALPGLQPEQAADEWSGNVYVFETEVTSAGRKDLG